MKKITLEINERINPKVKEGDIVRLIDGSGLSCVDSDSDFYIVYSYPEVTGINEQLKHIDAEVLKIGVEDRCVCGSGDWAYKQDIVIKIGSAKFRTCSGFVKIQEQVPLYTMDQLFDKLGHKFKIII